MKLPEDYLERVYAGVLGKVIGVYLGVPFEGWPREKIVAELGQVRYYVHEKINDTNLPGNKKSLLVPDDDIAGTFFAVRALEEHGRKALTAEEVGKTWLNNVVEDRTVFWWGGRGVSTEHTAYLNLKSGIPGGKSGSSEVNGKIVAEQIGGEIFIDAWAMCAPGNPDLAAQLAKSAASVSHDGESVYGAVMWAAMEAEAFISQDIDHLIDTGLRYIPKDCQIAKSTAKIRNWVKEDENWGVTRARLEQEYGTETFESGFCHVVPNHGLKLMSLLWGGHSFQEGLSILVTSGWDTDSNGGNLGALLGIIHGLNGFENGPDWRGPLHDRTLISTADGGYAVNNCTRIAYDLAKSGYILAGKTPLPAPKNGAQYHFTLPGSVQGFRNTNPNTLMPDMVRVKQGQGSHGPALGVHLRGYSIANDTIELMTDTFMPDYCLPPSHYHMMAAPLIYPGQRLTAVLYVEGPLAAEEMTAWLRVKVNSKYKSLIDDDAKAITLAPGDKQVELSFVIPDAYDSHPIQQVGIVLNTKSVKPVTGTVWLDQLRWTGSPRMRIGIPKSLEAWHNGAIEPWRRAWIDNASTFPPYFPHLLVSQSWGEGSIFYGTRDWFDYAVVADGLVIYAGGPNGLAARVQGINRWYGILFTPGHVVLVKALDGERIELARSSFAWKPFRTYEVAFHASGESLKGFVDGKCMVEARDGQYLSGGIGLIVRDGSMAANEFRVAPLE